MSRTSLRTLGPAVTLVTLMIPTAAGAIEPPDVAAEFETTRLFVEDGAETVDRTALTQAITDARRIGVDLRVAVLAEPGDAEAIANAIGDMREGTIIVFTPDAYGIRSSELESRRIDLALESSATALAEGSVEDGTRAFVDALDPADGGRSLTVIGAGVIGVILLIILGGRILDRRDAPMQRTEAVARRREALADRSSALGSRVAETAGRATVAGRPDITAAYEQARAAWLRANSAIGSASTLDALIIAERDLSAAEAAHARVRELLG